ncbi:hypothetical protein A0H81_09984 [Grifola frondosa]|uniref:Uncharacterized protein n=1 Tax=Grifola frondosa TaxID=5627 RepID=A0A1C7M5U1_GRIFR|nr:hypothetical protein A0H81_09984 [Grifola frondosa]
MGQIMHMEEMFTGVTVMAYDFLPEDSEAHRAIANLTIRVIAPRKEITSTRWIRIMISPLSVPQEPRVHTADTSWLRTSEAETKVPTVKYKCEGG